MTARCPPRFTSRRPVRRSADSPHVRDGWCENPFSHLALAAFPSCHHGKGLALRFAFGVSHQRRSGMRARVSPEGAEEVSQGCQPLEHQTTRIPSPAGSLVRESVLAPRSRRIPIRPFAGRDSRTCDTRKDSRTSLTQIRRCEAPVALGWSLPAAVGAQRHSWSTTHSVSGTPTINRWFEIPISHRRAHCLLRPEDIVAVVRVELERLQIKNLVEEPRCQVLLADERITVPVVAAICCVVMLVPAPVALPVS